MASRVLRPAVFALAAVLVLLLATQAAFGASVGRIKGTVTDSKTGEPLFGVSIQIEGTTWGAKTNIDGNYVILSVPPGTYNLKVSLLSYEGVMVEGVQVNTDQTAENNVQMKQTVIETGRVTVVKGQRKGIDINQTGTVEIRSQKEIQAAPVTSITDLLVHEAGITMDAQGELHIRGGRAGETSYLVDGVNFSDPLGGRAPVDAGINISSSSVLELQVIKDGFDPEYGEALSGIVKITSPEGSVQRTRTGLQFYTDDFGTKKLNKDSENYDRGQFNISGPDPLLTSRILPALGINYFQDKEFTYYLFAYFMRTDTRVPYSRYTSPATQKKYSGIDFLGLDIPDRQNNQYNLDFTLAFNPTSNMHAKLLYKGMQSSTTAFDWMYRYSPATAPVTWYNTNTISLQMKQVLSKSSDYEINLSYWGSRYTQKPGDPNHPGEGLDPDDFLFIDQYETYDDLDHDNQFDSYEPFINIFPDSVKYGSIYIPNRNEGDIAVAIDDQIGGLWLPYFDLNGNGIIDAYEGEPFVDLNGNGIWDMGDKLTRDVNGNGVYDEEYRDVTSPFSTTREEPYIDGDSSLGEPFTDVNKNGIFDEGIDRFMTALDPANNQDLNRNNRYDGPNDPWVPGIPYIDYNGNGVYDAPNNRYDPGEPYTDINKNGLHDTGGDNATGFLLYGFGQGGNYPNVWTEEKVDKYTFKGNLKKAIGRAHEIKTGFELRKEQVGVAAIQGLQYYSTTHDNFVYSDRGNVRDFYSRKPYVVVAYFRDKIEYGSLVASLGMRADLFFQDKLEGVSKIQDVTGNKVQKLRNKFSPRVSINYPISEKAMIRFNYGHFYDLPSYSRMYRNSNPFGRGDVSLVGNPNLNYMKTVNYTFGVNYAITDEYSVKMSGYYKDYFDIVATSTYGTGASSFSYYDNTDYARVRGFEIELGREASRYIIGTLSYTYQFAYGKSSSDAENYQRLLAQDAIPIDENPLDWDIRHQVGLWLQMYFTDRDQPRLFGLSIPNDWDMSMYWEFKSGFPFTPQKTYPGMKLDIGESPLTNSMRLPATARTDIKFNKRFRLSGMEYSFLVEVNNLFDNKNVVYVNTATGRPDTDNNQSGIIGGGTERQANPLNWGRGRQIILGLGLQF